MANHIKYPVQPICAMCEQFDFDDIGPDRKAFCATFEKRVFFDDTRCVLFFRARDLGERKATIEQLVREQRSGEDTPT